MDGRVDGKKIVKNRWIFMWYKNGLNFKCQGCGGCCKGFPGYVWINEEDVKKMAKFLKISKEVFLEKYTRQIEEYISLKELSAPSYDCIFLKDNKCQVYPVRPIQCSSYPFWPKNLESQKSWQENVKKNCMGSLQKETRSFEEIQEQLEKYQNEAPF